MTLITSFRRVVPAALLAVLAAAAAGTVGCAGPPRQLATVDGSVTLRVSDLERRTHDIDSALEQGETVALVFWQPACRSCALEAPALNRAVAEHGDSIRFLGVVPGVAGMSDEDVRVAAAKFGYRFPQTRDSEESICRDLDVVATPTLIVLGSGREIRYRGHHLPRDWKALATGPAPN